jgi:hypothetical protein
MGSEDTQAPDPYLTHYDMRNLKERIEHLEKLYLYHIHYVNDILGVTGGPEQFTNVIEQLKRERK